jgi:hypothetical protein
MKPDLQRLPQPWMTEGPAAEVMRALTAEGDAARFVGGCVRDALVGRNIRDIDIATPLSPQRVTELLRKAGLKAVPTGIDHGTITAVADKTGVEVTTLPRCRTDGRRARWVTDDGSRRGGAITIRLVRRCQAVHDYFGGLTSPPGACGSSAIGSIVEDCRLLRSSAFMPTMRAGIISPRWPRWKARSSIAVRRTLRRGPRLLTARRGPGMGQISASASSALSPWRPRSIACASWRVEQRHGVTPIPSPARSAAATGTARGGGTLKLTRGGRRVIIPATRDPFVRLRPGGAAADPAWGNDGARDRCCWLADRIDGPGSGALAIITSAAAFPIKGHD